MRRLSRLVWIAALLFHIPLHAEASETTHDWLRELPPGLGEGTGPALAAMPDGGAVLAGFHVDTPGADGPADGALTVVRLNGRGGQTWRRTCAVRGRLQGVRVGSTPAGRVILAGALEGELDAGGGRLSADADASVFVAALDGAGELLWQHLFGDDELQSVAALATDRTGRIVLAGSYRGTMDFGGPAVRSAGDSDVYVLALESDGRVAWARTFGDEGAQFCRDIAFGPGGGIWVIGHFTGVLSGGTRALAAAGASDGFVLGLDGGGASLWTDRFGDEGDLCIPLKLRSDGQGGMRIVGLVTATDGTRAVAGAPGRCLLVGECRGPLGDLLVRQTLAGVHLGAPIELAGADDGGSTLAGELVVDGASGDARSGWLRWTAGGKASSCGPGEDLDLMMSTALADLTDGALLVCCGDEGGQGRRRYLARVSGSADVAPLTAGRMIAGPNPFNPRTTLYFDVERRGPVDLAVYDLAGRRIAVLVTGEAAAGTHRAVWDGRDEAGRALASGVYVARLETSTQRSTYKLLLAR